MYDLHSLALAGEIPAIPIYIDSPLAIDTTSVFEMHPDLFDKPGYGWHIGANPGGSMVGAIPYALSWLAFAALPLFFMLAAIGNARFTSEAIDPTLGKESPRMVVDARVADNTLQQFVLFAAGSLALPGMIPVPASGGDGPQDVVVGGVPTNSRVAQVLVEVSCIARPRGIEPVQLVKLRQAHGRKTGERA